MYDIAIISGDGIGKEVMASAEYLIDKLDLDFSLRYSEAGFEYLDRKSTRLNSSH